MKVNYQLSATINASGVDAMEIANALRECIRLIEDGFTSGSDDSGSSDFSFNVTENESFKK